MPKHSFQNKYVCLINTENRGTRELKGTICCIVDTIEERDQETLRLHREGYKKLYWRATEAQGILGSF